MKTQKIFNITQSNFFENNNVNKPENPYGCERKTYDGKSGLYFYVEFIVDETYEKWMEIWRENKRKYFE